MDVQQYFSVMKDIQEKLLEFLESNDDLNDTLQPFTNFLAEQHIQNEILKEFLNLISKISMNHQRSKDFIKKIETILTFLKNDINSKISNTSLFNVFRDNKRILLFLFKNKFLNVNEYILNHLISRNDLIDYFKPEIILYQIKKTIEDTKFEENRKKGENCDYLCELIQNDSIEEFVTYLTKTNLSPKTTEILLTNFETNPFLFEKKSISLIEYATFYGSTQIVKYLHLNNVDLTPSLWLFAIHSNNPELIHFLEENHVIPVDKTYKECLKESIKCFHNDVARYIQNNLLNTSIQNDAFHSELFELYNFDFLSDNLRNKDFFNYLCKYDYSLLANIIIKDFDVNKTMRGILFDNIFISHHYMKQLKKEIKK